MRQILEAPESERRVLRDLHERSVGQMLSDPDLTDEQKQELLRQLELSDDNWKPVELPVGSDPVSETIIKLRRGESS